MVNIVKDIRHESHLLGRILPPSFAQLYCASCYETLLRNLKIRYETCYKPPVGRYETALRNPKIRYETRYETLIFRPTLSEALRNRYETLQNAQPCCERVEGIA